MKLNGSFNEIVLFNKIGHHGPRRNTGWKAKNSITER